MKEQKYVKIFGNTFMLYILAIAKIVFPLITLPYLTRVLSVESYGALAYIKSIMAYVQMLIDFGFLLSAVKDIVNADNDKEKISRIVGSTIGAKLVLSMVALVFIVLLSETIPILSNYKLLLFSSFIPPFLSCFLLDFLFRGMEKMHIVSLIYVSMKVVSTILTILLIKGDGDIYLVPMFDTVSSLIAIIITWLVVKKFGVYVKFDGIKGVIGKIKESFFYFTNSVASSAFGALNTALIGVCISDLEQVAYWSVSMQLVGAVQTMYTPLSNGIYPYMMKKKDIYLIRKILFVCMPIVVLGTVLAGIISPTLLIIVGGKKYVNACNVFRMLLPVLVISFPVAILGWPTLGSIDKIKQINVATLTGALVQIGGLVLLYVWDKFSIINVAITRNISECAMLIVLYVFVLVNKKCFVEGHI